MQCFDDPDEPRIRAQRIEPAVGANGPHSRPVWIERPLQQRDGAFVFAQRDPELGQRSRLHAGGIHPIDCLYGSYAE